MRITSGYLRSRLLQMPKGIRPTQDKVRKAIFDILGDIEGLSCCEFFAGSGAIGLEAISRGAKEVVFVESNSLCQRVIRQNIDSLQVHSCDVIPLDAQAAIILLHKNKRIFDLIFMDPPYGEDAAKKALQSLEAHDIVSPDGLVIIEHFKNDDLPDNLGVLRLLKRSYYGNTAVSIYEKAVVSKGS